MAVRTTETQGSGTARNEVLLVGRLAAVPEERELPSGDLLTTFRLVVDRPPPTRSAAPRPGAGRQVPVDTLDCSAWTAGTRRTARTLQAGDVVEVTGALRRRFWRAGAVSASRTEVEVAALRRVARALPRASGGSGAVRRTRRTATWPASWPRAGPADRAGYRPDQEA